MPATSLETVQNKTANGNTFTSKLKNDKLQRDDFLKIILEGFKNQDPTKPKDVDNLIENQLKLSTIETNVSLSDDMKALKETYQKSALYSASNMIGQVVEDGSLTDAGEKSEYSIVSIFSKNSVLYANAKEITSITDVLKDSTTNMVVKYDADGAIYDADGQKTDVYIKLKDQRFDLDNGNIQLVDEDNKAITDKDILSKYAYGGVSAHYAKEIKQIPIDKISKIGYEADKKS